MNGFRSELENLNNSVVEKDIMDLADKIAKFHNLQIDEEKFRSLRLARGVYGQRQQGVQMIRIKIPYGKLTSQQLRKIADVSDEYASSTLHATTRQDIQIHYVSLDRTPELWAKLEQDEITLREACGNTVRNITASHNAGIDPEEPFDVSPYAHSMFEYFLRNTVCQEMGRKIKISFSSSEKDSAYSFIHDLGFIPKIKDGKRGFKVLIGGGLGAQPFMAQVAHEFLAENKIIPFTEAVLRVFDRYGERARRHKARLKFLIADLGLEQFMEMVKNEAPALKNDTVEIAFNKPVEVVPQPDSKKYDAVVIENKAEYDAWYKTNVKPQKQEGFYSVAVRVPLGNLNSDVARAFANIIDEYAGNDTRITINQGYLLKFVRPAALEPLYVALNDLGLAKPGFDSTADITACPGTDTCNLGISSSTGISKALEEVIETEFPDLIYNNDIKIKISGCPNSCGQHGLASIGFHGSSLKLGELVLPALQVVLGGGVDNDGVGRAADKVIKTPSKNGPEVLRTLLADYEDNSTEGEYYKDYYQRQGKMYFYSLLKPLANTASLSEDYFIDWGQENKFAVETAVGECAGVIIDLVSTLLFDSDEKFIWAKEALDEKRYADAIYHAHNVFINSAKALLLSKNAKNNSHISVIRDFDKHFVTEGVISFEEGSFEEHVLRLSKNAPSEAFAKEYFESASNFLLKVKEIRDEQTSASKIEA